MKKILSLIMLLILACTVASATADEETHSCWILCQPDSLVNIRTRPERGSIITADGYCGMQMDTNQREKNGFVYVYNLAAEFEAGWVSTRYVVWQEPMEVNSVMQVAADGRVAARKWIQGKIVKWLKPGHEVMVYWMSPEWSVTSYGYIMTEFLKEIPENEAEHE